MARSVAEWIGATHDTAIPPRVVLRVFLDHDGYCHICTNKIYLGEARDCDHKIALINGGENRESNLAPAHKKCHQVKTRDDVAIKAKTARTRKSHMGIKTRDSFQTNRSGKWKKKMDGTVIRR